MKKRKKLAICPQEMWNPTAVEQWLEYEAERGWRLGGALGYLMSFNAAEPKKCRIRVHPQGPESREAFQERIAAYEEMGWQYAATMNADYEVFYCDDDSVPELFTDPIAYGWAWEKSLKRSWIAGWVLLLVALLFGGMVFGLPDAKTPLEMLLSLRISSLVVLFLLIPLAVVIAIRQLLRVHQARKQIKAGVMPEAKEDWRKSRRWGRAIIAFYVICIVGVNGGNLLQIYMNEDTQIIVNILPTELVLGATWDDWNLDWDTYRNQYTLLAPNRHTTEYSNEQLDQMRNTSDHLRFEMLAEMLYQEKLEQVRADWPEAEETAVEAPAFDEAVLLTDGDVQILLVRSEKIVYSLWVNFPVDMDAVIETVVSDLAEK